jgi:chromosome segregation ATPase
MDINQIAKMIEWLDEERRRDKQTIATLEQRLEQQTETITSLQRRVNSVESDQTVIKESSIPIQKERDLMETVRQEMRQMLETTESRRLVAEREAERRQELNREQLTRTVRDVQDQLSKLQRSTGSLSEVRSEGSRISDSVTILSQRIDDLAAKMEEPERRLAFLEEHHRNYARRISEIESEQPETKKQIDSLRPKVELIEDLSIRNERKLQEVNNAERERREQMQQFVDQQSLITQQRDQKIDDLMKRYTAHDKAMQENIDRFETWAAAHREMQRIISDFERIGDRLERRINEVAEMQRLSEDRFRQEWNDWRDDDQKRWKQLTLSSDEVWRNHDREFEQFVTRIQEMETWIEPLMDNINRLWNLERDRAKMYRDRYQELLHEHDTTGQPTSPTSTGTMPSVGNTSNANNGTAGNGSS